MADFNSHPASANDAIGTDILVDDDIDLQAIADSEIPEIQHEAQTWLVANNTSDQRAITIFAFGIAVCALILQSWWAAVLAACILLVLPFRWMAGPQFRDGNIPRGIMWANLGSWYLLFPMVIIVPDSLPIAIQNVIGPMILAAAYLERRVVKRLVPVTIAIAVTITLIAYTTDGVGLDEVTPEWLYVTVLLTYVGANLFLVTTDLRQSNVVRLRIMQRAINNNRELQAADQALRDSRRRLVVAADQERVSLERNLHDGAQQRLLSLSLQLRLAADLADEGPRRPAIRCSRCIVRSPRRSRSCAISPRASIRPGCTSSGWPVRSMPLLAARRCASRSPTRHSARSTGHRGGALLRVRRGDPECIETRWSQHDGRDHARHRRR